MKFGFIAGKPQKSFDCLAIRGAERGHEVTHIPLRDLVMSEGELVDFVKDCAQRFDALHYYAGLADPIGIFFGEICDELQIPLLNNRAHIAHLTHDKMFQTLSFVKANLPVPKTIFTRDPSWVQLSEQLGEPFIAKRVRGTHGTHVHKIESAEDLSVVDGPSSYLFQEFLPHKNDIRVLVLQGKAICAYKRVPAETDFRANLAAGGHAESLTDQAEIESTFALAEAAVKAMPHELAGVDIIKSENDQQYRLIEINTNPSWYGIFESTNMYFEDALLDTYEALARKRQ